MDNIKFKKNEHGTNYLLQGRNFYISYQPNAFNGIGMFRADNNSAETALCKDGKFFILNGDFRKQYEELFPKGYRALKKFYNDNINLKSSWSN